MLYLASTSPRRRDLLKLLGLNFRILVPPASEDTVRQKQPRLTPKRFAVACARAKALSVAAEVQTGFIIGVDTIVTIDGRILGKPQDTADARKMLRKLSGHTHQVISGVAIVSMPDKKVLAEAETTSVTFRKLGPGEIDRYVATPEPFDKAGAYGIQEQAGIFVSRVSGCFLNVVGLPVPLLLRLLAKSGWPGI